MSEQVDPSLPGRLGDPTLDLRTDPRTDPRIVEALAPFGMDRNSPPAPVDPSSPREDQLAFIAAVETGFEAVFAGLTAAAPSQASTPDPVTRRTETIAGPDGNEIPLYLSAPVDQQGPLPGVLHLHGGGMVLLSAAGPAYAKLRDDLAASGHVVVGVEFRNGAGVLGAHPYPAGLSDCAAALAWVHQHRAELGISTLTVAGESGGGNLSIATAIAAKRRGDLGQIDGVYALVPYISGLYGRPERGELLPSLVENDGYFMTCDGMAVMVEAYDPGGAHATEATCWPYHATADDLAGLPPHAISVNEVDPLRDEGIAMHARLLEAGVDASLRTVPGACHVGDLVCAATAPDLYEATLADLHRFASSLARQA